MGAGVGAFVGAFVGAGVGVLVGARAIFLFGFWGWELVILVYCLS